MGRYKYRCVSLIRIKFPDMQEIGKEYRGKTLTVCKKGRSIKINGKELTRREKEYVSSYIINMGTN